MRFLYSLVWYLLLPVYFLRLYWRSLRAPDYRSRWMERLGFGGLGKLRNSLWIHAVSVGETQAAEPLVRQLMERYPGRPIVITTTTPTGSERVKRLFGDTVHHVYFPVDLPFAITRFLDRVDPSLLVMMETEIWPNLLVLCAQRGVHTLLANARMSERSAKGYARLGRFTRDTFGSVSMVAAQTSADAERFWGLGVSKERVQITGSIKFDIRVPASLHEQADVLRRQWAGRPVWVAASTHEGEDEQVLTAHRQILDRQPDALLVLVPRHPERFERVGALCSRLGFEVVRRSAHTGISSGTTVFLGDTMGELPIFLAAADAAFVGGSLVATGGHNVLEPAALGLPVVFGPHMFNFSIISQMLIAEGGARKVDSGEELASVVTRWLSDASERARVGESGRAVVEANRGALKRLLNLIDEQLMY